MIIISWWSNSLIIAVVEAVWQWFLKYGSQPKQRLHKGHKMGCAEAIQTWVVYFNHYHYLSLSVCSVCIGLYLRKEEIADSENELRNLLLKIIHTMIIFIIRCLRHGSHSANSDLGRAQKSLGTVAVWAKFQFIFDKVLLFSYHCIYEKYSFYCFMRKTILKKYNKVLESLTLSWGS